MSPVSLQSENSSESVAEEYDVRGLPSRCCSVVFSLWAGGGADWWDVEDCDWEDKVRRWILPGR